MADGEVVGEIMRGSGFKRLVSAGVSAVAVLYAACSDIGNQPTELTDASTRQTAATASYTRVVGDDWSSYTDKASLKAKDYFYWVDAAGRDVYQYLDLKPDPTFGQVVRIMFPQNSGSSGSSPRLAKDFPAPIDKMWYRWNMKFTPGWTSVGPDPAGWANSYKIAFWLWDIYGGRGELEYSNTNQYITGTGFTGSNGSISYNETLLPGSAANFGSTASEWSDGEWYEFVVYFEKTSNTSFRQYYWRRKLTQGGVIVNNPYIFHGYSASGSTALPKVKGIELGINRNKNNPTDMYISWGPWEVVNGATYPNPFNMPNVVNSPPSTPTLSGIRVSPKTDSMAVGGTRQFSATGVMSDGSSSSVSVTWSATGGTVSSSGSYTAPSTAGNYLVIAREATKGFADTASVKVTANQPPAPTQTGIKMTPDSTTLNAGGAQQFNTVGVMSDGTTKQVSVTYSATGGSITSTGLYTAGSTAGTYRVIATSGSFADTSKVTINVQAASVTTVTISPKTAALQTNGQQQFSTTAQYSDGTNKSVAPVYSASGGSVNQSGLYTAPATAGTYKVFASFSGMVDSAVVTVKAPPSTPTLVGVRMTPDTANVNGGGSVQFSTVGLMSDGSTSQVPVTYSATGGSITSTGLYTAGSTAGTFRAIATSGSFADTSRITVVVNAPTVTSVVIAPKTASLMTGGQQQFSATANYSDGSSKAVAAVYSATGGSVTSSGMYTAPSSAGTFRVFASFSGKADSAVVTVSAPTPPPSNGPGVAGADWTTFSSKSALQSAGLFSWSDSRNVMDFVDLVADPTFGQVVRVTQPAGTSNVPGMRKSFTALNDMWFRYRVKFSTGWTSRGTGSGPGQFDLASWTWSGFSGNGGLGLLNSDYFVTLAIRNGSTYMRYNEQAVAGSSNFPQLSTQDSEWYEYVVHYVKTSSTSARQEIWLRRLTTNGQVAPSAWTHQGDAFSGAAVPTVKSIAIGTRMAHVTNTTQQMFLGPWEVQDGAAAGSNPFGVPLH